DCIRDRNVTGVQTCALPIYGLVVVELWYVSRFLKLKHGAFQDEDSYFHRYSQLDDDEAVTLATEIWDSINLPNLKENVQPSRGRDRKSVGEGKRRSAGGWVA